MHRHHKAPNSPPRPPPPPEFIADLFLCPLEAVRIRSVSDPTFPKGLGAGAVQMLKTDGALGFYAGLGPILFKQIPYTMAKFAVQGKAAEMMYDSAGKTPAQFSSAGNLGISLASGVVAGVAAAVISHPADTLLSKVNKAGAGGSGSTTSRLINIAKETGFVKLCTTGLGARCVMIGTLTAGQFGIFDVVMNALGASKFQCVWGGGGGERALSAAHVGNPRQSHPSPLFPSQLHQPGRQICALNGGCSARVGWLRMRVCLVLCTHLLVCWGGHHPLNVCLPPKLLQHPDEHARRVKKA